MFKLQYISRYYSQFTEEMDENIWERKCRIRWKTVMKRAITGLRYLSPRYSDLAMLDLICEPERHLNIKEAGAHSYSGKILEVYIYT